jgi:hypothetical protein
MEENGNQVVAEVGLALDSPRFQAMAALGVAIAAVATLYWFAPDGESYYPGCPFFLTTGWYCPGCGSLRALHALLHGHFVEAVDLNAWLMLILPFGLSSGIWQIYSGIRLDRYMPSRSSMVMVYIFLAAALLFGVARNLPVPALVWLAP